MSPSNGFEGVPKCYIFKSRLQEYAQKTGIPTPVYETTKEGPSHEPSFRSTVIVNDVKYDSLPGFFNRKAAEQSAAEIALMGLAESGNLGECISNPLHESGLCKNLLQEYAQKMNYAIPSYVCERVETPGKVSSFTCTIEIGGIQYIGAAARTKKEAEIKAARTALLAIQAHAGGPEVRPTDSSQYTVVPCKKKGTESTNAQQETTKALKPKKTGFKKKWKKFGKNKGNETKLNQNEQATDIAESESAGKAEDTTMEMFGEDQGVQHMGSKLHQNAESGFQAKDSGMLVVQANQNSQNPECGVSDPTNGHTEIFGLLPAQNTAGVQVGNSGPLVADVIGNSQVAEPMNLNFKQNRQGTSSLGILPAVQLEDLKAFVTGGHRVSGTGPATSMVISLNTATKAPVVMGVNPLAKDNGNGQ
ncbi:double-stranded RNA-binding protein 1-like [Telopea speciosissima]|uniref:double-stranded RNA-binding protein 1-like n=1 Tax=Telopea speciosissima TaxID=54955 RepID=UPI001CC5710B|nr:double-stranded RNA-binding protein 1-like [Telopea speciosissima]